MADGVTAYAEYIKDYQYIGIYTQKSFKSKYNRQKLSTIVKNNEPC